MLSEVPNVRQVAGQGTRRWFTDEYFDLIVWYGAGAAPVGFQLCYDKSTHERAVTWTAEHGYQHNRVDAGEVPGHSKMTPVIVADGAFERAPVAQRFREACSRIDPRVASFVLERLSSYPA
ncbi:MAG TPA: hypothetical protein VMQ10_10000 [Spirochaetia bacterium]|nr:hypothetical protein [Spirochaetia bacterium]